MAISVQELYNLVSQEARKDVSGGWFSEDKFNSFLKEAELFVLEWYYKYFEDTQDLVDHLRPFVVYKKAQPTDKKGYYTFPDDYAHRLAFEGLYVENPKKKGDQATVESVPCPYLQLDEVSTIKTSSIVAPDYNKKRFYHTFRNNKIEVMPQSLYWVDITYLRYPVYGKIAFTYADVDGQDQYTYDAVNSLDLEWNDITRFDIAAVILWKLGITLKDTLLIQVSKDGDKQSVLSYLMNK